jgi:hypothetical protein
LQLSIGIAKFVVQTKFGNPNRSASSDGTCRIDIGFEVGGTGVLVTVPMQIDEINVTACAVAKEVLEIL